jgi:hypothetical protein
VQFDALMLADREDIGPNRFHPEALLTADIGDLFNRHKIFRPRHPSKVGNGEAKAKMDALIRNVFDRRLTFDFMSLIEVPKTGKPFAEVGKKLCAQFGLGKVNGDVRLYISLAYQELMPLMSGNLNSAEILADQFSIAVLLVHEFLVRPPLASRLTKTKTDVRP